MTAEELSDKLGLANYHKLKKMSKATGLQFLSGFILSDAERIFALTLCNGIPEIGKKSITVSSHRRAVMWICGASLRQMAMLDGVSVASIQQGIRRHLGNEQREAYNTRTVQILTPSQVSAVEAAYKAHEAELSQLSAIDAADRIQDYVKEYLDD